jgi:hypothetical protein
MGTLLGPIDASYRVTRTEWRSSASYRVTERLALLTEWLGTKGTPLGPIGASYRVSRTDGNWEPHSDREILHSDRLAPLTVSQTDGNPTRAERSPTRTDWRPLPCLGQMGTPLGRREAPLGPIGASYRVSDRWEPLSDRMES